MFKNSISIMLLALFAFTFAFRVSLRSGDKAEDFSISGLTVLNTI
jgi:hypothetical protein